MSRESNVPEKANRVLNLVLIALLLITIRVWHLTAVQRDEKLKQAAHPKHKTTRYDANRGMITDRFGVPLAMNKVQYHLAIQYSEIREIPWRQRKKYIQDLSSLLAAYLHMDPERIEDVIHSKAAFYHHLPYLLKEDLPETTYYRLKGLEREWPGLLVQRKPKRYYPLGKVGAGVIGYTGAINRKEYRQAIEKVRRLEEAIALFEQGEHAEFPETITSIEQAKKELFALIERAYSLKDRVGKMGIEKSCESQLRGAHGTRKFMTDAKGNFLKELEKEKKPRPGRQVTLTLSAELQEYCEQLLATNETFRLPRFTSIDKNRSKELSRDAPFVMGGAIVAMDPNNGEVLALASYPRFDPNDFVPTGDVSEKAAKRDRIHEWFETREHLAALWDKKRPLTRDRYDVERNLWYEETVYLSWEHFLEQILPKSSRVHRALSNIGTVDWALHLQARVDELLFLSGQNKFLPLFNLLYDQEKAPYPLPILEREALESAVYTHYNAIEPIIREISPLFSPCTSNREKALTVDLCRLLVDPARYSKDIYPHLAKLSLRAYREENAACIQLKEGVQKICQTIFHFTLFESWKKDHQKSFLREERAKEKKRKQRYAKPYLDLLDAKEHELFAIFWEQYGTPLLLTFLQKTPLPQILAPFFDDLTLLHKELLEGAHTNLSWAPHFFTLKKRLDALPGQHHEEYLEGFRSFDELTRPLLGQYTGMQKSGELHTEQDLACAFYPKFGFGYARSWAFRQAASQGSVFKLITAYAALTQQTEAIKNLSITESFFRKKQKSFVGYDHKGNPLPQFYKGGKIATSTNPNMGKVNLERALEVSSNPFFSFLASDFLKSPEDLALAAKEFGFGTKTGISLPGEYRGHVPQDLDYNPHGLFAMAIGQHTLSVTPLQTAAMIGALANGGTLWVPKIAKNHTPQIKNKISLPKTIQQTLLRGMKQGVQRASQKMFTSLSQHYTSHPEAISDFLNVGDSLVGKTGTAESVEILNLDPKEGIKICNHIWFAGVSYPGGDTDKPPELVVVVYFRYGAWGKDTFPIAAQVVAKWREICQKRM